MKSGVCIEVHGLIGEDVDLTLVGRCTVCESIIFKKTYERQLTMAMTQQAIEIMTKGDVAKHRQKIEQHSCRSN